MRRGSTPTNTFHVNLDLTEATIFVTYSQNGCIAFEKTGDDLEVTEDQITVSLTQTETLSLKSGRVEIQIRYVLADGTADASNIMSTTAERILKDGEIAYV